MAQLVTRIDDALVWEIDAMVAAGEVASRSEAVRLALIELIGRRRRERIGAEIVAAYCAHPQDEQEVGWSDVATRRMIADEPW